MPEETSNPTQDALAGDAKGKNKAANVAVARALARFLWLPQFRAANPEMGNADIAATWKTLRQEQTKPVAHALRILERRGYSFTAPAGVDGEEADTAAGTAADDDANS